MQAKNYDGSYGDIKPFDQKAMEAELQKDGVSHVEVFEGTPENIAYRSKLLGVKKRYKKAPKNSK